MHHVSTVTVTPSGEHSSGRPAQRLLLARRSYVLFPSLVILAGFFGCNGSDTSAHATHSASLAERSSEGMQVTDNDIASFLDSDPGWLLHEYTLSELQSVLETHTLFNVTIDSQSLEQARVSGDTTLPIPRGAKTTGDALAVMLRDAGAGYYIASDCLTIASNLEATDKLIARTYVLSPLDPSSVQNLANTLVNEIPSASWQSIDGLGGSFSVEDGGSSLVVIQSFSIQEAIRRLINQRLASPVEFITHSTIRDHFSHGLGNQNPGGFNSHNEQGNQ